MTFQPGANVYTQGFGSRPENVEVPHIDVRAPTTTDILYPLGKVWVDKTNNAAYTLTSFSTSSNVTTANWAGTGGGAVDVSTLTGDTGTATPVAGNIKIAGTANQITTAASGSTVTLSLPSAITAPGSLTTTTSLGATTTVTAGTGITSTTGDIVATAGAVNAGTTMTAGTGITATTGNITATNGNVVLGTAGNKLGIATGANASVGTADLGGGTVTVSTTAVTANSIIFLTYNTTGGTPGILSAPTASIVPGTSFQIVDSSGADLSTVNWWIIN